MPFRRLGEQERYKKYDWLECDVIKNTSDPRPESYRPADISQLVATGNLDRSNNWQERRRLLLRTATVYTRLQPLIDAANANKLSLAVFKPAEITDFIWEQEDREWDPVKVDDIRARSRQRELFEEEAWRETFKLMPKLPYSFSYCFEDADGKKSTLQVLDWETGQLYWKCLKQSEGNELIALGKVKNKYFEEFQKKDLHFYLGTTQQFHGWALNPWVIIGVLPIPHEQQASLF